MITGILWEPDAPPGKAQIFAALSLPKWWNRLDQFDGHITGGYWFQR